MSNPRLSYQTPAPGSVRAVRPRVAVLLDYMNMFGGGYEDQIRNSFDEACRELDLSVVFFYGRSLGEDLPASSAHNAVFDLVGAACVDGAVVMSTSLASGGDENAVHRFVERLGIPVCSIGIDIPGVPSVVVDGSPALAAVLDHVIGEHGRRRPAFIAGTASNPEGEARHQAYLDALRRHGIEPDARLVVPGYFRGTGGYQAAEQLIARGVAFDAVIAANDTMALGAIDALRQHGYRVPAAVAVTGFDDLMLARMGNPPLTTVAQPFRELAITSLQCVLDQIHGRVPPQRLTLSAKPALRRSCGCGFRTNQRQAAAAPSAGNDPGAWLKAHTHELVSGLSSTLEFVEAQPEWAAELLLGALQDQLLGQPDAFLHAVERILERLSRDGEGGRALQDAITFLREQTRGVATPDLEDLWHDARDLAALAETTWQAQHRMEMDQTNLQLLHMSEALSVALDLDSLEARLFETLPMAGVKTAAVSYYAEPGSRQLTSLLCLLDGQRHPRPEQPFDDTALLPPELELDARRITLLTFPLVFESKLLGVAVFESKRGTMVYPMLRDQIAAALRSVTLHDEMMKKTLLHERSVQERLATSKRMRALSVLAGGVAHDLNNTLGPLVGLPDILLRQLERLGQETKLVKDMATDIASIKVAAERTSQTVKNLLTLGRQGRTPKDKVDLNRTIADCLNSESLRMLQGENDTVEVVVMPCAELLTINAAEGQVVRAVTNLVRNALEATAGKGRVVIETKAVKIEQPTEGYELIQPGDYAQLTISDDGSGIPEQDLARVFEPFFSRKRAGDRSGTGLGLAIVHSVVKEHAGYLDVTSRVGVGTVFTLYFPRAPGTELARDSSRATPHGRAKILIVDDEPVQLRTGSRLLGHLGYQVDTANTDTQAYDKFVRALESGKSPYDLIILDVILGEERDGLDLFEQIQELFPQQRALLVSGHAPQDRMELAAARGLAWLPKPYTMDTLAQAVQLALPDVAG